MGHRLHKEDAKLKNDVWMLSWACGGQTLSQQWRMMGKNVCSVQSRSLGFTVLWSLEMFGYMFEFELLWGFSCVSSVQGLHFSVYCIFRLIIICSHLNSSMLWISGNTEFCFVFNHDDRSVL